MRTSPAQSRSWVPGAGGPSGMGVGSSTGMFTGVFSVSVEGAIKHFSIGEANGQPCSAFSKSSGVRQNIADNGLLLRRFLNFLERLGGGLADGGPAVLGGDFQRILGRGGIGTKTRKFVNRGQLDLRDLLVLADLAQLGQCLQPGLAHVPDPL